MNYFRATLNLTLFLLSVLAGSNACAQDLAGSTTNVASLVPDSEQVALTKTSELLKQINTESDRYAKASKKRAAVSYVVDALTRYPDNVVLLRHLSLDLGQFGAGARLVRAALEKQASADLEKLQSQIDKKLDRLSSSEKMSTVSILSLIHI